MVSIISRSTPAPIGPPSAEDANLLGKGGAGFVEAGFAERLETHAEGPDRTGDPGLAALLLFKMRDGLAGQA